MTELERQLAAYTGFLEARSVARAADHTTPTENEQGDVIVVDLMERLDTEAGDDSPSDGKAGRRTPVLFLAAAAVVLIVAVVALLNTGDEGANDVVTDPDPVVEEPEPAPEVDPTPVAPLAEDPLQVGELVESAITTGTPALASLYAGPLDGLTDIDVWSAGFATPDFGSCSFIEAGQVSCPVEWRFDAAPEGLPTWFETHSYVIVDGLIQQQQVVRGDLGSAPDARFEPYRFWFELQNPGIDGGFDAEGVIRIDAGTAALHRDSMAAFFADLDDNPIADRLTTLWRQGTLAEKEAIVSPDVTGTVDDIDFSAQTYWLLTNIDSRDLIPPTFEACAVDQARAEITCTVTSSFEAFGSDAAGVSLVTFDVRGGQITELVQNNPNNAEVAAGYAAYRDWVFTTYPDEASGLFLEGSGLLTPTPTPMARHAELAAEYLSSVGG